MTRTSNPCAVVLAFAAIAASGTAMAANTITFSGEVTDQTCQVAVNGFTDPTVILDSVPVDLAGGAAVPAGDIVLANGATSTSYDYAVQYVSEAATVTPGPVLGAVTYTLRYE